MPSAGGGAGESLALRRYTVNQIFDHGESQRAPVVDEENPNGCGRVLPSSGSTVRKVVVSRPGLTLVWHAYAMGNRPVVLVHDRNPSAAKALEVAVSLLKVQDCGLINYLVADNREQGLSPRLEVSAKLRAIGVSATFHILVNPSSESLAWIVKNENAGPVVLPCDSERVSGKYLCSLIDEIANPVLLVK